MARRLAVVALALLGGCDRGEVVEAEPTRALAPRVEPIAPEPEPEPESDPANSPLACTPAPPPSFVDLSELIPTAIVAPGYHGPDNFTGAPLPGYAVAGAWLEREAGHALAEVARALERDGLRLIVFDAYRPRRASEAMVAWCRANGRQDLLERGWVAARSAHGRGRAVDLGLAREDGTPLDMGSSWDQFDRSSHLRGVEGEPLELRLRLREAMVRAGFEPYAREWWHFAYRSDRAAPILDVPYACAI